MPDKQKKTIAALRKHLRSKTDRELVDEIAWLYKSFEGVKDYYTATIFEDDSVVLKKYKTQIEYEFFPKSWRQDPPLRLSVAKKAIRDYKKVCSSDAGLADIMLFYIETIFQYIREYGHIKVTLIRSALSMYRDVLKLIYDGELGHHFVMRGRKVAEEICELGYDPANDFVDIFHTYFQDDC